MDKVKVSINADLSFRLDRPIPSSSSVVSSFVYFLRNEKLSVIIGNFVASRWIFRFIPRAEKEAYFDTIRQRWTRLRYARIPRFIKWLTCKTTVGVAGIGKFPVDRSDSMGSFLYFFRVWEPYITNFMASQLKSGDIFVDIGANFGYYSVLAGQRVGSQGKVYAFEPAPTIYSSLRKTLAKNRIGTCRALNVAASSNRSSLPMYMGPRENIGATSHYPDGLGKVKPDFLVAAGPVHDFIDPQDVSRIKLIKIDTEGHEIEVLKGMHSLAPDLPSTASILVEYSDTNSDLTKWSEIQWWLERGYRLFSVENEYLASFYNGAKPWLRNGINEIEDHATPPTRQTDFILSKMDLTKVPALANQGKFSWPSLTKAGSFQTTRDPLPTMPLG